MKKNEKQLESDLWKLHEFSESLRQQGIKNSSRLKHKKFNASKKYWEGYAQASANFRTIVWGYLNKNGMVP